MELSVFLFFIIMVLPGLGLILSVRRVIKEREWLDEQHRIQQERVALKSVMHRAGARRAAQEDQAGSPVEAVSPQIVSTEQPLAHPTASQKWSDAEADSSSWQDLNASHVGAAFESFLEPEDDPSPDPFTTSQINDAFEQWTVDSGQ